MTPPHGSGGRAWTASAFTAALTSAHAIASAVVAIRTRDIKRPQPAGTHADGGGAASRERTDRIETDLARTRIMIDASPVGVALADEHGHFIEVNLAFCDLVGRGPDDLLGGSAEVVLHPEELALLETSGMLIEASPGGVSRLETRMVRSDGTVLWTGLTLNHVTGPQGQVWTLAHVEDISDRRRADQNQARSAEIITAAHSVAHLAQRGGDPRGLVLESLVRIVEATSAQLIEPLDETHLVITHSSGGRDLRGLEIDLNQVSVTAHVWRTGSTVFADMVSEHPLANRDLLAQSGASSLMWAPVQVDDEVQAVVSLT